MLIISGYLKTILSPLLIDSFLRPRLDGSGSKSDTDQSVMDHPSVYTVVDHNGYVFCQHICCYCLPTDNESLFHEDSTKLSWLGIRIQNRCGSLAFTWYRAEVIECKMNLLS